MRFDYVTENAYFLKFKTSENEVIYFRYLHGAQFIYNEHLKCIKIGFSPDNLLSELFDSGYIEQDMSTDEYLNILGNIEQRHIDNPGIKGNEPDMENNTGYFIVYGKSEYVRESNTLFPTIGSAKMYLKFNYTDKHSRKFKIISYNEYVKLMNELD